MMLKVYLEAGLEDRLETVVGEFVTENERYLVLGDGTIRRKIPHRRIVHIEDLSEAFVKNHSAPVENSSPVVPSPPVTTDLPPSNRPIPGQKPFSMSDLRKKLKDARGSGDIPPPTVEEVEMIGEATLINVIVTGADQRTFNIEVPAGSFTPDRYTASTAKELSKNPEIKSLLDRGMVFDGPPTVVGKNIYVKTKTLSEKVSGVGDKINLAGKLQQATQKFMQPEKNYQTDFTMNLKDEGLPAIPHSPFEGPIMLEEIQPIHPDVVVEGDPRIEEVQAEEDIVDENSVEESGIGEEEATDQTSEGNQGVFEKSPGD